MLCSFFYSIIETQSLKYKSSTSFIPTLDLLHEILKPRPLFYKLYQTSGRWPVVVWGFFMATVVMWFGLVTVSRWFKEIVLRFLLIDDWWDKCYKIFWLMMIFEIWIKSWVIDGCVLFFFWKGRNKVWRLYCVVGIRVTKY